MKKQTKIWLFAAAFALLLTLVFTIGALAADEVPAYDPTNPLSTPYGMIPEDYESVDDFPFVAFDDKGTFLGAANLLINDGNAGDPAAIFHKVWNKTGNFFIFMRRDFTHENAAYNMSNVKGVVVVDLGGHTLNYKNTINFQLKNKGNYSRITFKNGYMHAAANKTFLLQNVLASNQDRVMQVHFTFENITFSVLDNFSSNNSWISALDTNKTNTNPAEGYRSDFTFKNCTFNTDNLARQINIVTVGHPTGQIATDITFSGVNINGPTGRISLVKQTYTENVNVLYEKNEDGYYLTNTRPTANVNPLPILQLPEEGPMAFCQPIATEGNNTTYALSTHERLTPYGWIPEEYYNNPSYPILMFLTTNNSIAYAGNQWGGETNESKGTVGGVLEALRSASYSSNTYAIYFQADHQDASGVYTYYNIGNVTGAHIVDLNGHTLTLRDTMFHAQAKNKNNTSEVTYTIKNGDINVGKKALLNFGSNSYDGDYRMTTNYIFENVDIIGISGTSIIADGAGGTFITTNNVTFRNCTFTYSSTFKNPLFNLGAANSTTHTVNIVIEGGSINYATNAFPSLFTANGMENKTLTFIKGVNGYPQIITKGTTSLTEGNSYYGEEGEGIFLLTKEENGYNYYTFTRYGFVSAYLNLTNDLNLVYRTFVPEGFTNPTVTFTVGESTKTVTEYTVDENGYYCFKLPNINPARMGETVTATLNATYGEQTVTVANSSLSVKKYAQALKAQNAENTALVDLVDKLLVYGAAAQQYLGQSADTFVTEIGTLGDIAATEYILSMNGEASDKGAIAYFGMNIDGAFAFRLGIVANVEGLTLVAQKGDKTTTYNLDEYTAKDGIITVVFDGILANELDETVTFTLMAGDEVVGKTLVANANSYLYRASIGENVNLATLAKALYAYGVSANGYTAE